MESDQSQDETARKSEALRNLSSKGALPTAVAKLSGSSRIIPSNTDFHFYNNFDEFKKPIAEIDEKSKILLRHIGASENLLGKPIPLPDDDTVQLDEDLALDWLVSVNDEILERFDVTLDDFKRIRKKEEESGERTMRVDGDDEETGFQKVYGKKDKRVSAQGVAKGSQEVKVATRVPPKVHFHVASIPRPQDVYKIIVNNLNQPFEHVWLEKSADGSTVVHPLEKLNVFDFIDASEATADPERPLPIEVTPFMFVEDVKALKQLAEKLRSVDEFAVDLEHNQYRSFQGLTCLMQISTRTEDFVIDTLKLRIHIGPYLRELFKDPTKRKVMHGANSDIFWLQRDFGIYVCNMFDTGQASRVLKMERFSLEHLLIHFCEVQANKVYQNADWRVRPLPHEMIKYAREDTHYLLYIYDRMRMRLLRSSAEPGNSDHPLVEVYKQSYYICTRLYEKELLTDTSYLNIYGLLDAEFNSQQLAIVSGLYQWRDVVARSEDESTGYVLPNRSILDIAKQVPLSDKTLRYVLKTKNPFIERNISSILSIIRHSIQNAAAFEEACEYLKAKRAEMSHETRALPQEESEILPSEAPELPIVTEELENVNNSSLPCDPFVEKSLASMKLKDGSHDLKSSKVKVNGKGNADFNIAYHGAASPARGDSKDTHMSTISSHSAEATVEASKKPSRAFGALFRNSAKRKFNPEKIDKEESKLEQIKSTVSLPFHTFSAEEDSTKDSPLVDIIVLDDDSGPEDSEKANSDAAIDNQLRPDENNGAGSASEEDDDEPMSLSHLSSSFQKCFPSLDQVMSSKVVDKSRPSEGSLEVKPFDYEAARKQVKFGKDAKLEKMADDGDNCKKKDRKKGSAIGKDDDTSELPQGRRRQAFPASGNRSATFKQVS